VLLLVFPNERITEHVEEEELDDVARKNGTDAQCVFWRLISLVKEWAGDVPNTDGKSVLSRPVPSRRQEIRPHHDVSGEVVGGRKALHDQIRRP
jgi:hypothetical protein